MPKLITLTSRDGKELVVAARTPEGFIEPVGAEELVERIEGSLDSVFDFAVSAANRFATVAKDAGAKSAELELGLGFTAKGTVFVCETTGSATIKLKFVF
jgi:hypothetical protein